MNVESERTKIRCSVRFEMTTTRIMQLDDIEFYLDAKDDWEVVVVNDDLIARYVSELWAQNEIDPCNGSEYSEEECFMANDDIREVVSFEICKPPQKFTDPDQMALPLS